MVDLTLVKMILIKIHVILILIIVRTDVLSFLSIDSLVVDLTLCCHILILTDKQC